MSNVQSLERALTLINVLSEFPDGIKITRLSERVGLSKSTTHRLLHTLVNMNYVIKDTETDRYKLGYQVIYLARNIINNLEVIQVAKPYLEKLCKDINETIHLCIEDNGEVMYVDKIESNQPFRMSSRIGSRVPMYCTAVGKILLSSKSNHSLEEMASTFTFSSITPNTITTKNELLKEIEFVNKHGFAIDNMENVEGIRCIAGPIHDFKGNIIASFSISGPANRITSERIKEDLERRVKQTSLHISHQLGYLERD